MLIPRLIYDSGDQSKLNGKHVVIGRVVEGMEAVFLGGFDRVACEMCWGSWGNSQLGHIWL